MNTFTVHFDANDRTDEPLWIEVEAEYYRRADGWVTFKDGDHQVVADVPEGKIRFITSVP